MLIGIDVSRTAEAKTGLASYASSLIAGMARVDRVNQYLLYPFVWDCFPQHYERAFCPAQPNFQLARKRVPRWLIRRLWRSGKVDQQRLLGGDPDVFFSPFHSVPRGSYRRLVCVFHDVSFRVHPEFSGQANIDHCEQAWARAVTEADHLITVSEFSRREMVEHMGVPADRISVTHEAADPMYRPLPDRSLPERIRRDIGTPDPLILYVGSVEPRKNLTTLVRAFDALLQRSHHRPTLVIAGGAGWKNSDVYAEIERRGLRDRIYFTGFVTDQELVRLYNACTVFVFPTIYEGFGLPVIEAMQCGTPVVTTRVASIPEVGGDAVAYVDDPFDEDGLSRAIEAVLDDPRRAAELRERGLAQAARFTWDQTARATLAVLERVHREPGFRRRRIAIGADERGLGRGWHPSEPDGDRRMRWMEREATARLCPAAGDRLVVEAAGNLPGDEQVLSVRLDGRLVGQCPLTTEYRVHAFPIPAPIPRDVACEVTLRVNFELPPDRKHGDPRQLGARVARFGFEAFP